jgi:hypothetical protein
MLVKATITDISEFILDLPAAHLLEEAQQKKHRTRSTGQEAQDKKHKTRSTRDDSGGEPRAEGDSCVSTGER